MALSNLTRVCFWEGKERRHEVTAGRRQPTFIQGRVFFSSQEDAMMLRDSSTGQCSYFGIRVV